MSINRFANQTKSKERLYRSLINCIDYLDSKVVTVQMLQCVLTLPTTFLRAKITRLIYDRTGFANNSGFARRALYFSILPTSMSLSLVTVLATEFYLFFLSRCQTRYLDIHELLVRGLLDTQ